MFILSSLSLAFASAAAPAGRLALPPRADEVTAPRSARIAIAGARVVRIRAGAGYLRIQGRPDITEVRATGTARASSQEILRQIQLVARRSGDAVEIETVFPDDEQRSFWSGYQASLDVTVEVPGSVPLDVTDGSGDVVARSVGALTLTDGSGDVEIDNAGATAITDGSGDLTVQQARGDVRVSDGSGDIRITGVRGSVTIPGDGSGDIDVADVTGSVAVERDGSGSVTVERVAGDFTVRTKGSGPVRYSGVRGRVSVPERNLRGSD